MRYFSGILFILIAALPYVSMLRKGSGDIGDAPSTEEKLIIISPHRREVQQEYDRGFREWLREKHNRSIGIEWLDVGGTSKIMKDLESRFATRPDSPGVDLLFGGGIAPYYQAIEHGWLQRTDLPTNALRDIPKACAGAPVYDEDMRWFGVALSGFGIIYNRVLVERMNLPIPTTWEILGVPEYQSWIASGDPRSSGSVHMCYEIILQVYGFEQGWGLITRICANVRRFGEGGGVAPREVAAGDVAAGMVIDQYAQTVIAAVGEDALAFVLPEDATVLGADAIGVLNNAPSPDLARLFIEYTLTEHGQRLLFQPAGINGQKHSLYRLPVMKTLYDKPDAPPSRPYDYHGDFVYNTAKGSKRWRLINDMVGVRLIDAHANLVAAWRAVIDAGMDPDLVAELCASPVAESDIEGLIEKWSDPRERVNMTRAWAHDARRRYASIRNKANIKKAGR